MLWYECEECPTPDQIKNESSPIEFQINIYKQYVDYNDIDQPIKSALDFSIQLWNPSVHNF